jgi:glycopeptide antibiotics resistance protein
MGVAYLLFLAWAALWKCGVPFIGDGTERVLNLLPFNNNTQWELQFNVVAFMPLGFYLAAYRPKSKVIKKIAATFVVSFVIELVQFVLAIGFSDITDLLMNTLGGIIGIVVFYVLSWLFGRNERKATLVVCVLFTLLVLYMTVSFMVFRQLNIGFMVLKLM